jgi:hypothetical protein
MQSQAAQFCCEGDGMAGMAWWAVLCALALGFGAMVLKGLCPPWARLPSVFAEAAAICACFAVVLAALARL